MKRIKQISFYTIILLIISLPAFIREVDSPLSSKIGPQPQQDIKLTIYTYESLLEDPGYDIVEGFANVSDLSPQEIQLIKFEDANQILTEASLEKDNPEADVLIGLDNVLIHTAKEEEILTPYDSSELINISTPLIENLDPDHYLLPFDYGIISLFYDMDRINSTVYPSLANLTLNDILELDLDKKLIVQDPTLSSPGLGFLLWTIAVFGDPTIEFEGLLGNDWRDWWRASKDDLRIAPSWGTAFAEWYESGQNRPLMVSYGSSPAYSAVQYNDTSQKAILTHELNRNNAWYQIEGIGLVKNSPHPEMAKQFIDWFLSPDLQDHISTNNWMYPANTHAYIHPKFENVSINPENVDLLNDLINASVLKENLSTWKNDWENIVSGISISGFPSVVIMVALIGAGLLIHHDLKLRLVHKNGF